MCKWVTFPMCSIYSWLGIKPLSSCPSTSNLDVSLATWHLLVNFLSSLGLPVSGEWSLGAVGCLFWVHLLEDLVPGPFVSSRECTKRRTACVLGSEANVFCVVGQLLPRASPTNPVGNFHGQNLGSWESSLVPSIMEHSLAAGLLISVLLFFFCTMVYFSFVGFVKLRPKCQQEVILSAVKWETWLEKYFPL